MNYDVIILGAGGAGMMCAIHAGRRNRRVLLIDHSQNLGGKILISGGGRCNFTNLGASPANYVSRNPHFCKSALSRYPSQNFIEMVQSHGIGYHEKKLGQLFCNQSAREIVQLLKSECEKVSARFEMGCRISRITQTSADESSTHLSSSSQFPYLGSPHGSTSPLTPHDLAGPSSSSDSDHSDHSDQMRFTVETSSGKFTAHSLVVATGGLSIPKIGATGFGYQIARQFGLKIVNTVPALDGFTFADTEAKSLRDLSGVSLDCIMTCNQMSFRENLLFTHSGLSGPASLQASLHWNAGDTVILNVLPDLNSFDWFLQKKKEGNRSLVKNLLSELLPRRFSELFCNLYFPSTLPLPQVSEKSLEAFCKKLHHWELIPSGTVGYSKAEVTRGGVDTDELSSKTLESKKIPGLFFIGEVVDVTGWLGGYNFQWAWASGWAAGQVV